MAMSFSPENEKLLSDVVASGKFETRDDAIAEALHLLRTHTKNETSEKCDILPPDEWLKEFDRITESRKCGNPKMDDSRESIYGDRGL